MEMQPESVPLLAAQLEDTDPAVRRNAVKALGRLGASAGSQGAACLAARLADVDVAVRAQAARSLGLMGASAASQAESLIRCLEDSEFVVRAAAVGALGYLTGIGASIFARILREDPEPKVRVAAAGALGRLGSKAAADVAEVLAASLVDKDQGVRVTASGAIAQHIRAVTEALRQRLKDTQPEVRQNATRAFGHMADVVTTEVLQELVHGLSDSDSSVRSETRQTLKLIEVAGQVPLSPTVTPESSPSKSPQMLPIEKRDSSEAKTDESSSGEAKTDESSSGEASRKKVLTWASGFGPSERREHRVLPTLLGTPTPKRGSDKPNFCLPSFCEEKMGRPLGEGRWFEGRLALIESDSMQ